VIFRRRKKEETRTHNNVARAYYLTFNDIILSYLAHFLYLASRDRTSRITVAASEISIIIGAAGSSNFGMAAVAPEVATLSTRRKLFEIMLLT
jgi:hypothetical protein